MSTEDILELARKQRRGAADILSNLIARYASKTKGKDSAFDDQPNLLETIKEIAELRACVADLKNRNTKLLSQLQEYEAREY